MKQVKYNFSNTMSPSCGFVANGGKELFLGNSASLVNLSVFIDPTKNDKAVQITLTGPSNVWFGVGFGASRMGDAPWTIIVEPNSNDINNSNGFVVTERKLQDQNPGILLQSSITVVSTSVNKGLCTVVLTRAMKGITKDHFTFDISSSLLATLPFINAIGSTTKLSYHKMKTPSTISILPVNSKGVAGTCVCLGKPPPFGSAKGELKYTPSSKQPNIDVGSGTIVFPNKCTPKPRSDLLSMKNPTCDIRSYTGGQAACHHMFSLLDADQDIPWTTQPLEYNLKFRFWVQPYDKSYHTQLRRVTWGIASPVEYDVPKCSQGIEGCSLTEEGIWVHKITGTFSPGVETTRLSAAHFHCHAPSCLSISLYLCPPTVVYSENTKGVEVCNETNATLLCEEKPVYGNPSLNPKFSEKGFILQPPCLWGSPKDGLEAPPDVTGRILHTVKYSNATYAHHGEMAWQQMYVF